MKHGSLAILALALFAIDTHAQGYQFFTYKGRVGITDSTGKEVQPPEYESLGEVESKHLLVLHQYKGDVFQDMVFNTATRKSSSYRSFNTRAVEILGEPFSLVTDKNKTYLLSETSDRKIPLPEEFYSLRNEGNGVIIGKYFKREKPAATVVKYDKNGIPLPPPAPEISRYDQEWYALITNEATPKIYLLGCYTTCLPLYAGEEEDEDNNRGRVITMKTTDLQKAAEPVALLCADGSRHTLYTVTGQKAGVITQPVKNGMPGGRYNPDDAASLQLMKKAGALLKRKVSMQAYGSGLVSIGAPPGSRTDNDIPMMPVQLPAALAATDTNGGTIVYIRLPDGTAPKLFFINKKVELRKDEVTIITGKDKSGDEVVTVFYIDLERRVILLPKQYFKPLGIIPY